MWAFMYKCGLQNGYKMAKEASAKFKKSERGLTGTYVNSKWVIEIVRNITKEPSWRVAGGTEPRSGLEEFWGSQNWVGFGGWVKHKRHDIEPWWQFECAAVSVGPRGSESSGTVGVVSLWMCLRGLVVRGCHYGNMRCAPILGGSRCKCCINGQH